MQAGGSSGSSPRGGCWWRMRTEHRRRCRSGLAKRRSGRESCAEFVAELREEIDRRTRNVLPGYVSQAMPEVAEAAAFLKAECGVDDGGAEQLIAYVAAGRAVLGVVPTVTTIVAERFFDEGGGMQLILHAPFGGRINKAWGLALRKRFCRGFNFELQAAATDNGLNICLAEQHSFPLSDVFHFLTDGDGDGAAGAGVAGVADLQDALALGCCAEFATVAVPKGKESRAADPAHPQRRSAGQRFSAGGRLFRKYRGRYSDSGSSAGAGSDARCAAGGDGSGGVEGGAGGDARRAHPLRGGGHDHAFGVCA